MRELAIVGVIFVLGAIVSLGVGYVGENDLLHAGWLAMMQLTVVAVALEVVYFVGLYAALRRRGFVPPGWYQRSFEHHHLMSRVQKLGVLPFFYVGGLLLTVAFVLALTLAFAALRATLTV